MNTFRVIILSFLCMNLAYSEEISLYPFDTDFPAQAYVRNPHVPQDVWDRLSPYFLPMNHPLKPKLDKIFKKARVLKDEKSMKKAGFEDVEPRKWTRLIVTTHPKLPGHIIKAYLDRQHYHAGVPEYELWLLRIHGAQLIRDYIHIRGWGGKFKVPNKWIYPVPADPAPPAGLLRKNFILVVEDMDIQRDSKNEEKWKSNLITPDLLDRVFGLITDLGLRDCAKPDNIPFAKDGRIAFVDTQTFNQYPISYHKLLPFLTPQNQAYWQQLIQTKGR